ncbi:MAG: hypothetical protein L0H94_08800 [Nitrospira sp.]|nr:hypothetical protein [Nitrospira sp.]
MAPKAFGQFYSNKTQRISTSKPVVVILDAQENAGGAAGTIDFNKGDIIIKQAGLYLIIAGPQVGKVTGTTHRWIDLWLRVNNTDVRNSNIRAVLKDPEDKTVALMNCVLPLKGEDKLNVVMAAESIEDGLGLEMIAPNGEPTIPSIIITVVKLD